MKRIIILAYDFPSNNGGIARTLGLLYENCHKNNVDVKVITCSQGDSKEDIIRIIGERGVNDWRIYRTLKKSLQEGDVIITDMVFPAGLMAVMTKYPTYILAHGAELLPRKNAFVNSFVAKLHRIIYSRANKVIANSEYTKELVAKCSPKADVVSMPPAIDVKRFVPTKQKRNDGLLHLCTISRLEKFKAQDFIIQTIAHLPEEYRKKVRLTIGGKGPYKSELERLVSEKGIQDIVTFRGFISDVDMCDFYSENDLFILTTREDLEGGHVEGFGLVYAEAQACGTPVIGTNTGGIPDAIEEGNGGWLINQDDEGALSDYLIMFLENKSILLEQGRRARIKVETHNNWDVFFFELMNLLSYEK